MAIWISVDYKIMRLSSEKSTIGKMWVIWVREYKSLVFFIRLKRPIKTYRWQRDWHRSQKIVTDSTLAGKAACGNAQIIHFTIPITKHSINIILPIIINGIFLSKSFGLFLKQKERLVTFAKELHFFIRLLYIQNYLTQNIWLLI